MDDGISAMSCDIISPALNARRNNDEASEIMDSDDDQTMPMDNDRELDMQDPDQTILEEDEEDIEEDKVKKDKIIFKYLNSFK